MATTLTANLILQKTKLDNLRHVRKLNVCGAQVSHIHVLRDTINVQVISLSVNSIEDLSPLSGLHDLRELYLRKNNINDLMQVLHLSRLENLEVLGLSDNPICADAAYRAFTIAAIPSLLRLDDIDITPSERRTAESEFSEVRHWGPPDPIPFSQVTGSITPISSTKASPSRGTTNTAATEYVIPQTARRPHQNSWVSEDDGFPPSRMPATARGVQSNRGSISSLDMVPQRSMDAKDGLNRNSSISGGWDDVPVGGGGMKRPKAGTNRSSSPPLQRQGNHEYQSPTHQRRLSSPPERGQTFTHHVQSSHRDPMSNVPPLRTDEINGGDRQLSSSSTYGHRQEEMSKPAGTISSQHRQHNVSPTTPLRNAGDQSTGVPEESVIAAIKMLMVQLSSRGVAEVQKFATSLR